MNVTYRIIAPDELDAPLMDAWRAIQSKSNAFASPYFCPEFTRLVGSVRDDVQVVVIENDARPVGFFPHQRSLLGMGKPVGGPLSDYHGIIAEPGSEWNVADLMRSAKLAVWEFDHLVDVSKGFDPYVTAHDSSPQIDLSAGYQQYVGQLRGQPSDFERKARKLAREVGELRFTLHEQASGPMQRLIEWKSEQYRRTSLVDAFGVRWTGELLRRIMNVKTAEFAGVCSVLRAGDRIVAVHAGMRSRQVLHWWFPTYDRAFEKYSPGIILLFRIAEALAATGVHTIDLGKGDDRYKRSVMTGMVELREGFVEMRSLLARARQLQRIAAAHAARGGLAAPLHLPLGAIRRIQWLRKYR